MALNKLPATLVEGLEEALENIDSGGGGGGNGEAATVVPIHERLVGNGGDTYALTNTPPVKAGVHLFVGGAVQGQSQFSLDDNTITFNENIPNDIIIDAFFLMNYTGGVAPITEAGLTAALAAKASVIDLISGLGNKVNKAGDTLSGTIQAPKFLSSLDKSDIPSPSGNAEFMGKDGYWGLRTDTANRFNLDIWNAGNPRAGITVDQLGRVMMPYQPAFLALASESSNAGTAGVLVTNVGYQHNIGNHFNSANGRFSAPVNGVYHFDASILSRNGETVFLYIRKNGTNFRAAEQTRPGTAYSQVNVSLDMYLIGGDYVEAYVSNHYAGAYGWFSGHLVG